eukprot:CAMPEP_0171622646 /NCGR_PEP_ID=MMETSP0990-20121206/17390_1 /TAXON_ID=483369 /ORGANISM="non described non described, Strain CCMP2098" /LENGTH=66 /DNA_ID=CAMNT_0012188529 /DNA_START=194 /DNA_END=394 /DNA_ORIENTATION=+
MCTAIRPNTLGTAGTGPNNGRPPHDGQRANNGREPYDVRGGGAAGATSDINSIGIAPGARRVSVFQ